MQKQQHSFSTGAAEFKFHTKHMKK